MKKLLVAALLVAAVSSHVQAAEPVKAGFVKRTCSAITSVPSAVVTMVRSNPKASVAVAVVAVAACAVAYCPEVREFLGLEENSNKRCSVR